MLPAQEELKRPSPEAPPGKALEVGSSLTPRDPHHRAAHSQQASPHGALTVKSAASSQARVTGPK